MWSHECLYVKRSFFTNNCFVISPLGPAYRSLNEKALDNYLIIIHNSMKINIIERLTED